MITTKLSNQSSNFVPIQPHGVVYNPYCMWVSLHTVTVSADELPVSRRQILLLLAMTGSA